VKCPFHRNNQAALCAVLFPPDGGGNPRPIARASSIRAAIASFTQASASSGVSLSDMQPGRSGTSATKPPPSFCGSGSMITGYSRSARFAPHLFHEPDDAANIERLDRSTVGNTQISFLDGSDTFQCDPPPLGCVECRVPGTGQRHRPLTNRMPDRPSYGQGETKRAYSPRERRGQTFPSPFPRRIIRRRPPSVYAFENREDRLREGKALVPGKLTDTPSGAPAAA
jgi:hypothetical protein